MSFFVFMCEHLLCCSMYHDLSLARSCAFAVRSLHDTIFLCTCMRQVLHVDRAGAGLKVVGKLKSRMHVQSLIQDTSKDDRAINLRFF